MKKVLFIQNIGNSYGGVYQVNKLIGEELGKYNYDVTLLSIRDNKSSNKVVKSGKIKEITINEIDEWNMISGCMIKDLFMGGHLFKAIQLYIKRIKYIYKLNIDSKKLKDYICEYDPDYIISSHYQLLDMIPSSYLSKTIHHQHSSFANVLAHKKTLQTLYKYRDKVKYLWLTKSSMNDAISYGLFNSIYIYNAVRFESNKASLVSKNKKLITIARLDEDKSIDIMINIIKNLFKDSKYQDWNLEIYGDGSLKEQLNKIIDNHKQIKLMGITNDPKKVLLTSAINLNTSKYEGFSLSILEAQECGVPTVAFNFGESAFEQIINNETGFIVRDNSDFINKLKILMDNSDILEKMSSNCRKRSEEFHIDKIIKEWINLLNSIDN